MDEDARLQAIHSDMETRGQRAAALGAPFITSSDECTILQGLPNCLLDLHDGMPRTIKKTQMRMLKIPAVLAWDGLKVYEEVDASNESLEVPYGDTDDELWKRVVVISWRWGEQKPAEYQRGFTPMAKPQFEELTTLLRMAEQQGLEYVWIDWSCVPQYSVDSMVEVHRSKIFYARSRVMLVIPTFRPLPEESHVLAILARLARELTARAKGGSLRCAVAATVVEAMIEKDSVAGCEYFGRVWTLAERMARHGRGEGLCQWLSLESWLGMIVDAMLKGAGNITPTVIYKKMLGQKAAGLLDAVLGPLLEAEKVGGLMGPSCEGLDAKVANLCEAAVGAWLSPSLLAEEPTRQWLHTYLGQESRSGVYQAWQEADRVWAVYSYFCWKLSVGQRSEEYLRTALEALFTIAAGDRSTYEAGISAQLAMGAANFAKKPPALNTSNAPPAAPKAAAAAGKSAPAAAPKAATAAAPKAATAAAPKAATAAAKAAPSATPKAATAAPKAAAAAPKAATAAAPRAAAPVASPKAATVASPKAATVASPKAATVTSPKAGPVAPPKAAPMATSKGAPAAAGKDASILMGHSGWVYSVAWSPDGRLLASGSGDGTVRAWDVASGSCNATLEGHSGGVWSAAWSPDGRSLASGSRDSTVRVWDAASGSCTATLKAHSSDVSSVVWSPDGRSLASGSNDNTVRVWDASSGRCTATLEGHSWNINSVAWSPDGRSLASCSRDKTIRVWSATSGRRTATLEGCSAWVNSVAWSPDGKSLASGSGDRTVRVWDAASGSCTATLKGHSNAVRSVAWSPDGRSLASGGGEDKTIRVWDVAGGSCTSTLGHPQNIWSVAWSPDGRSLASGSGDKAVHVWVVG